MAGKSLLCLVPFICLIDKKRRTDMQHTMLVVLALLVFIESSLLTTNPAFVKQILSNVSVTELRVAGIIELAIAIPALIAAFI